MARFSLLITSSPVDDQGVVTAINFARAALAANHQLCGIFFYGPGTHNANSLQLVPTDEFQPYSAWLELAAQGIPLHVCVTAAARRGILSETEANEQDSVSYNLTPPFQASGLGQFIELMNSADRVVQF
ncbi:sulfurtransferase complex subunit TusD [Lacimicrobium alkaliphilum]|uniref:Sulfurtransferase TusD n=1 Tax=Lacimicrobium alkaliphilum TaxID=1526571 RepID=A0ABQ1RQP7_9ALTE|nr:sulfurtransferase complex subunit TusD [Lacimicrobium alkaliphilum]GGD78082.1 sulfurtransferase TusD [Lacimicrobium alkaliphilum]